MCPSCLEDKNNSVKNNNRIVLLRISYKDFNNIDDIIKSYLVNKNC